MDFQSYLEAHRARFREELFSLIRIPSISSDSAHKPDMTACAERWRELLLAAGADRAEVLPTSASPVVFAEKILDTSYPTVLVYGHYDVMPVEPLELWKTSPFEPVIENDILYARGADDDKGQSFLQLKAFEYALKEGLLRCNVKFIIEGGEEIGSPGVAEFCRENKELLRADVMLVSDTSMVGAEMPSITTGLRGLAYWQIEVTGPNHDLHSGIFGGAVANPVNVLCKLIAGMTDADGRITLPGFYDDVENVSPQERAMLAAVPYDEEKYKANIGVQALCGEKGYTTLERTAIRPTFDVCGIWGGYTGEGAKTVLPSKAFAKISCRLVPHQNHEKIAQMMIDHLHRIAPAGVQIEITSMHGGESYVCPIDLPAYKAAEKGYEEAFGKRPLAVRRGGSIPIIAVFEKELGIKSILMGFGLESDATHSPNENMPLDIMRKGIKAIIGFYKHFGNR